MNTDKKQNKTFYKRLIDFQIFLDKKRIEGKNEWANRKNGKGGKI